MGPGSSVVKRKVLLRHLPEAVKFPSINQTVSQCHLVPGRRFPSVDLSHARYRKWPRIGHLDICHPSYGQKKGRESNWQFDSRPLKVGNRPLPEVRIGSAIRR
ncbi:unnamed protein product [Sphagnum troendelagicum]|uniref:Uncharacterized protein n=1 Tax=Sphagnum troendelagicum TaxID=128251 RepID=A0ABP0TG17_9BRYO